MQRRPPGDDERDDLAEYEMEEQEEQETYVTDETSATPIPRRRSSIKTTRSLEYNDDAYPHLPKVLRASRLLPPQEHDVRQGQRRARVEEEETEYTGQRTTRRLRNTPTPGDRPTSPRKPYRSPLSEESEGVEEYRQAAPPHAHPQAYPHARPQQTGKIMVIPPRRTPLRATEHASPQPPRARPAHGRNRRNGQEPLLAFFQEWPYRKPALIVVGAVIVLLILVPILSNVISSATHPASTVVLNGTQTSTQKGTITAAPSNPHELVIIPSDTDHPAPPVFATSAYLLDADTGVTLYAHNPFMHLPMLSTTKLMTAVIAVQKGNPNQSITITPAIEHDIQQLSADSSLFGMKQGEKYSLRDLLYGLFLVSGNDAAVAIAHAIDGSQASFVAEMNQRAKQLGLYDTHYVNPHGLLDPQQYSSAHDLAILARYAFTIPLIHQISGTEVYTIPKTAAHQEHLLINEDQFMWWYPGVDAGKTGYDGDSDFVQVVSVIRNHHDLIGVVMHTKDWWTDMRDLMNWGFDNFSWVSPYIVDFQHPIPYDTLWNFFVKDKQQNTIPTANGGRYYIYSGYSISGPIMTYFDSSGGLKKFGYPTGLPKVPNGQTINQQFQHSTIQCNLSTKQCQKI